ncbi:MAG: hypothetical protein WBN65_00485 [Gammaproteobacteria bacterium]
MATVTKHIGLSLGADICWPICYEELIKRLDPVVPIDGGEMRFAVDRVSIEPFSLRQPCRYDVVVDRLTHWFHPSREWIKKSVLMDGVYVFNNPWSLQSMEKHTSYVGMMRLGLPVPDTWLLPQKSYLPSPDLQSTLERYASLFDLDQIGEQLGYPSFLKPYDGGAWVGVNKIENGAELHAAYDSSGTRVMHLQKAILPHDRFIRCIGLGPQLRPVSYDPGAALHDRYRVEEDFLSADDVALLGDMTLTINSFFGWDFNSCEALRQGDDWFPIDFANACPDSQVTSLHYHFPWLVMANVRWSLFCAASGRRMRPNLDWAPYFDIADSDRSMREKISAYAAIAHQRFETERFEEFCAQYLSDLDEVALEFFTTDVARDAVRKKVEALFPAHEIDEFTELFWQRIQQWRDYHRQSLQ